MAARIWRKEEDDQLLELLENGYTPWQIARRMARQLSRTVRAVDTRARELMRRRLTVEKVS